MSQPQGSGSRRSRGRRGQSQRGRRSRPARPSDIWAVPAELPAVEPIVIPHQVDALVRSLGDGPQIGGSTVLDGYVIAVVERAAAVAAALALSADVLADRDA